MKTLKQNIPTACIMFVLLFTIVVAESLNAQTQTVSYSLTSGGPQLDFGKSIINRVEGGFVIAGHSNTKPFSTYTDRNFDWMFLKLLPDGITVDRLKLLGFTMADSCFSVVQLKSDSQFVMSGFMTKESGARTKATFVKVNKFGNVTTSKRVKDTSNHQYRQGIKGEGDTLLFTGWCEHRLGSSIMNKMIVSRYKPDGNLLWSYKYAPQSGGSSIPEEAFSVCYQPFPTKYYVVAARYCQPVTERRGILLMKLDRLGNILGSRTFIFNIGAYITEPRKIIPMPDGGYVIVGFTNAFDDTAMDVIVMKVNSSFDREWLFVYGNDNVPEYGQSIVLANDGNLVFTGYTGSANSDVLLVKLSPAGGFPIWSKTLVNLTVGDRGFDLINTPIGAADDATAGYITTGHLFNPPGGGVNFDPLYFRTDVDGDIPGSTCTVNYTMDTLGPIPTVATPSLGKTSLLDSVWTPGVRTPGSVTYTQCISADNPTGIYDGGLNEATEFSLKQNYPNPFNPKTIINYELPITNYVSIKVYDTNGKEIMTLVNESRNSGSHKVEFDGSNLSSGIYYYKIVAGNFIDIKKMILLK